MTEIVLASASPRRRELMQKITPNFTVAVAEGEETATGSTPKETAVLRAREKALAVKAAGKQGVIIGADTVVALGSEIFGKPKDGEDAVRMLSALSGKTHFVYTGVCLAFPNGREVSFCGETAVTFHSLTEEEIRAYVEKFSPLDKAGAYGIQDGFPLVKEISGSYDNVVGFPTEQLFALLKKEGVI